MGWQNLGEKQVVETPWFRRVRLDQAPGLVVGGKIPSAVTATVLMLPHQHRPADG